MTAIAETLTSWALSLRPGDVPDAVRSAAARHLLDGLGCAVAASRARAAGPAVDVARSLGGGRPEASVLGLPGERLSRPAAALANGVLVHALDFDDTHTRGLVHATAPVLPVVLAEAEHAGHGGEETITALVVGLETVCRLAAAAPHAFHARGLHATAVCGVLAAALVAARLRGLTADQAVNALGIAGSRAGGLLEFLGTGASTKRLHPGFAAHDGMVAAALAAAGMTGPATVLEGERGLYRALAARAPDRDELLGGLGGRWETTRITVKPYPACQLLHAQLDAARALPPGDHVEIVAEVHPDAAAIVCGPGGRRPRNSYDARFSLPWSLAAMLTDGEVTLATYDRIDRPEVLALAARVRTETVAFGGAAADQPGRVRARTASGEWVTAHVPRSRGGPGDPDLDATVRAKALANLGPGAEPVADLALTLADLPSTAPLMTALESHAP
ncbi:MmgE/PrpD family protein [Actinomadura kijaniata]|uniref:MmgE/PrpD family protein n=1 Tax=Actinomadura kijaniata TaxID=46161 RepID=UPI00082B0B1E|nr:MmgE/PrpD family protein [Actinomadura kijaniata]